MKSQSEWIQKKHRTALAWPCLLLTVGALLPAQAVRAAERKFLVNLATSPKQFAGCENNQPPEGLVNFERVWDQYFDTLDPGIGSFAEYWEEISYGDVTITGTVTNWMTLPWAIEPPLVTPTCPPVGEGAERLSPENFTDLNGNGQYNYGAAEAFNTATASAIIDLDGDPMGFDNGPFFPGSGSGDVSQGGQGAGKDVYMPGERYLDVDGDGKWDALDEANNWRDGNGDGMPDNPGPWIDLNGDFAASPGNGPGSECIYLPDADNDQNPDCCPDGPGTPGCEPFPNANACPATKWIDPQGEDFIDCNGNMINDAQDIADGTSDDGLPFLIGNVVCMEGEPNEIPDECDFPEPCRDPESTCDDDDPVNDSVCCVLSLCDPSTDRTPVERCEFADGNGDDELDVVEPFENFLRRWDPCFYDPDVSAPNVETTRAHWIKVYDPNSGGSVSCDSPETGFTYAADTIFQPEEIEDPNNPGEMIPNPLYVTSYIENNYPGSASVVLAQAQARVIYGEHDPNGLLGGACVCSDPEGTPCGNRTARIAVPDGTFMEIELVGSFCAAGTHADFNPSDSWTDVSLDIGPTKMRAAPGSGGLANFVTATPEPGQADSPLTGRGEKAWFPQAWDDRYAGDELTIRLGVAPSPTPVWPTGFDPANPPRPGVPAGIEPNTMRFQPWTPEADGDGERDIRRFFKANFGGTAVGRGGIRVGMGSGWHGSQPESIIVFESGLTGPTSFEDNLAADILPEEQNGMDSPIFFDGWAEHDDLPSSKYHRAGDQRLGEVTSPWRSVVDLGTGGNPNVMPLIWGDDLGTHELNSTGPGGGDQITPAAGPLAVGIYGANGRDAGNLLLMEFLTWRTDGTSPSYGLAWEDDYGTGHPYAGPGSDIDPNELIGFRDYNLDGMIDQGEVRVAGSENYVADGFQSTINDGSSSEYPWNRERLTEDVVEFLDDIFDFDDWVDTVTMARRQCAGNQLGGAAGPEYLEFGENPFITANGVVSGIILLPRGSTDSTDGNPFIGAADLNLPIHNEDNQDPEDMFPKDPNKTEKISWNLVFHDLVAQVFAGGGDTSPLARRDEAFLTGYSAHEYLHSWEDFPDLYDYDVYGPPGPLINTPIGAWDIMATGGMVHPIPILKAERCVEWIDPVDLTTVLTPGVPATITLPPAEFVRDDSYYFIENENREGEKHWFWSAGGIWPPRGPSFDTPLFPGFGDPDLISAGMPGAGLLIAHTDVGSNLEALPAGQQGGGRRFDFRIIQADGQAELEAGMAGDDGDPWPGVTNNTSFDFRTNPPATWYTTNAWTGIKITDIRPDGAGSVAIDISWRPTSIPSIEFIQPAGGLSLSEPPDVIYQIRAEATDVFGGTLMRFYYTDDQENLSVDGNGGNFIGSLFKGTPGTHPISLDWNIVDVPDGRYYVYAELIPGAGADGTEQAHTRPRASRNNAGDGTLSVDSVGTASFRVSDIGDFGGAISSVSITDTSARFVGDAADPDVAVGDWIQILNGNGVVPGLYPVWPVDGERLGIVAPEDPRLGDGPATVTAYEVWAPCFRFGFAPLDCDPDDFFGLTLIRDAGTPGTLDDFFGFTTTPQIDFEAEQVVVGDQLTYELEDSRTPQMRTIAAIHSEGTALGTLELSADPAFNDASFVVSWQIASATSTPARSETWLITCNNALCTEWVVYGTLTQPAPELDDPDPPQYELLHLSGDPLSGTYDVDGIPVKFTIDEGATRFELGDSFAFTTTGTTATSSGVTVAGGQINESPTAVIKATPLSGISPLTVEFDGRDSFDPTGQPLVYSWDFGDDTAVGTGALVNHTFEQSRDFTVVLRVTNPLTGLFGEGAVDIEVINNKPNAVVLATPLSGPSLLTIQFDASLSNDTETPNDRLLYEWDFGDGEVAATGEPGVLVNVEHFYAEDGEYVAMLTVEDEGGKRDSDTVAILVGNTIPVPVITHSSLKGPDPHEVVFNAINSFDADGDALTVTWTWGDGTPDETWPTSGAHGATDGSVPHVYVLPAGETEGIIRTSAIVTDAQGASATWPGVDVEIDQPVVGASDPRAVFQVTPNNVVRGEEIAVDASLSFDRPAGDLIVSYSWNWGDGSDPDTGVTATHTYESTGTAVITLTVADGETPPNTNTTSRTIIVSGTDLPPVQVPGDNLAPSAILQANPVEGVATETTFTFDARASVDQDGDTLTYSWSFGDGSFGNGAVVTHVYDNPGSYSVRLTVKDENNASTTASQVITVVSNLPNAAPVARIGIGPLSGTAPINLTFDGRTSFDTDGDPLTYRWEFRLDGVLLRASSDAVASMLFENPGVYTVTLEVKDGRGGVSITEPKTVSVTARVSAEPDPGQETPDPSPTSGRTGRVCGFGMLSGLLGSLLGLSLMMATRRRYRL